MLLCHSHFSQPLPPDTFFFANKTYTIERTKVCFINASDFPFPVFKTTHQLKKRNSGYSAINECDCKESGTTYSENGNFIEEKTCIGSGEKRYSLDSFIDTVEINLKNEKGKVYFRNGRMLQFIGMIRFKLVYEGQTTTVNLSYDDQSVNNYFATLYDKAMSKSGLKFIVVEEMFYNDRKSSVYRLPYTLMIKPK